MSRKRRPEPPPIRLGEVVPGSRLVRRYWAGREIPPSYVGPFCVSMGQTEDNAIAEATLHGYRAVEVFGSTLVLMFGEWIVL